MPPVQCPECGRFLKQSLVDGLAQADAPCPRCGTTLTAARFGLDAQPTAQPQAASPSVRPPDLTAGGDDPLAGWDRPGAAAGGTGTPGPDLVLALDPVKAAIAAAVGASFGALVDRSRTRGVVWGGLLGVVLGALIRALTEGREGS